MGTFTPFLNLFKPDATELVDVAEHLNENYDKVDSGLITLDSRVGTVEGLAGVTEWTDYVPASLLHGTDAVVGVTWTRCSYLRSGGIVHVEFSISIPSATYNDGLVLGFELPFENVGGLHGTGLLEKSDTNKIPYFFFYSSATYGNAWPLKAGPPIEIDWEAAFPSSTYSATFKGGFTYRTNGVAI